MNKSVVLAGLCMVLLSCGVAMGDLDHHSYEEGEEVILWVNKVGPFRNPQETYFYYSLPFCQPKAYIQSDHNSLGESLQSYDLTMSPVEILFRRNSGGDGDSKALCTKRFSKTEAEQMKQAVADHYWYQLFVDDLPIWGMVGEVLDEQGNAGGEVTESSTLYVYSHMKLSFAYNGNQIIEVNLTTDRPVLIDEHQPVSFTYSVTWQPTDIAFADRFDKYLDEPFFEHQIHFFSIFNSFMMVVFLVGLVSMILMRTLRRDYIRFGASSALPSSYRPGDDSGDSGSSGDLGDDSGWKQINGDVFRPPSHLPLFSALVGTGHQLVLLVFFVLLLSMVGAYYRSRGTIVTVFIVVFAFTSFVAGYAGGGYYARNGGTDWIRTMFLTASLFPGAIVSIAVLLNIIAYSYGSLAYVTVTTGLVLLLLWVFISFPLTLCGTLIGKNWNGTPDNPCRTTKLARQIPARPWYLQRWLNIVLAGILPFGSIFIEMYFIFTSFWHYKYYYVYSFLLLVYIILIIVTSCVTIVSTYFLLNFEDWKWQWTAFWSAASTAVYVFVYATYYFVAKTKMSGFFQTCFYFGYTLMFTIGLGILCGTIGFVGTGVFVRRIYRNLKLE